MLLIEHVCADQYMSDVILLSMHSTTTSFKLKVQLLLVTENDPSTCIEFYCVFHR